MQPSDPRPHGDFRPDIEGLRGLAILLVLAFHVGLPGIAGGFIGVDVFFVLSGFLITGLLLRERERAGRVSLTAFYARRARRILPAATVVLLATLGVTALVAAPLDLPRFAADAAASALSAGNIRFADQGMDYFAQGQSPSPFLHYWSLGVEEQFYLIWPALLIIATRGRRPRLAAGVTLAVVLVASLVAAFVLTDVAAPWAFYSLPSRAWQLAAGGLLACVSLASIGRLGAGVIALTGWAGLGAIIAGAFFVIDPTTPYPGLAALLPTLGSVALVAAGMRPGSPGRLFAIAPMRFLGRISFSLYLVHWPLIVLPTAVFGAGGELPLVGRIGLGLASIVIAWPCWRFIEEPFRRGSILGTLHLRSRIGWGPGRSLVLSAGAIALSTVLAVGVAFSATAALDAPVAPGGNDGVASVGNSGGSPHGGEGTDPDGPPPPGVVIIDPEETDEPTPTPAPTATAAPTVGATPSPTPAPTPTPVPRLAPGEGALPADVAPKLSKAAADWERIKRDGCELAYPGSTPPKGCVYGDPESDTLVVLVGDSHAGHWFPALDAIAKKEHWKLVPFVKFSCRFSDVAQYSRILKRPYTECNAWLDNVAERLRDMKPDLVVVASTRAMAPMNSADDNPTRQGAGTARLLTGVTGKVALLVDTPQSNYDVPVCLSSNKGNVKACATPRKAAFGWRYLLAEKAAAEALGERATIVNMSNWICTKSSCPAVMGRYIVYRDGHHLTASFAAALAPALASQLPRLEP